MNADKLTENHRRRMAVVYVRQSTATQVLHSHESRRRQYALREHAERLGFATVRTIDEDLGRSGSGLDERPGFAQLLELVCRGQVGAVFALEASRLARNNRDWHLLVDLCAMSATLVIDHDGVYDARLLNDRLLLGLKGTMSEFELGLLRQRAQEALRQKIARGEVLHLAPAGYERTPDNRLEMSADEQVRQSIREVFACFRQTGSARQSLLKLRERGVRLPSRGDCGDVVWRAACMSRVICILKHPVYAGAYAYGRTTQRVHAGPDGRARRTGGHARAREEWSVLLHDRHPGYITWAEYEANQRALAENLSAHGRTRTAVKDGAALLAGLVRCGHCGRMLFVSYRGRGGLSPAYQCRGGMNTHGGRACCNVGARRLDEAVSAQVLAALQPHAIDAVLLAEKQAGEEHKRRADMLRASLEKARHEAGWRRRQFEAVDPGNRLVGAELEKRWNTALQEIERLEQAASSIVAEPPLDDAQAARLRALGAGLSRAWSHPAAPARLKKRILRALVEEVIIRICNTDTDGGAAQAGARLHAEAVVHWAGGAHTVLPPVKKNRLVRGVPVVDAAGVIRQLAGECTVQQIAAILNRNGSRAADGACWRAHNVAEILREHGMGAPTSKRKWPTLQQATARLGVAQKTLRRLIGHGLLKTRQVIRFAPCFVDPQDLCSARVRKRMDQLKATGRTGLPSAPRSQTIQLSLL
jgi:DNA invertase Pin-like site-specific DNA recombinase